MSPGTHWTGQSKEASKSDRRLNGRLYELVLFEGIMEEEDAKDLLDRQGSLGGFRYLFHPKLEEDYLDWYFQMGWFNHQLAMGHPIGWCNSLQFIEVYVGCRLDILVISQKQNWGREFLDLFGFP